MNTTLETLKQCKSYDELVYAFCFVQGYVVDFQYEDKEWKWYIYTAPAGEKVQGPFSTEMEAWAECVYKVATEIKFGE